ncbi:substrate-binding domain-containing protein, partial [Rhizobiaceae sp. 2RAB30]
MGQKGLAPLVFVCNATERAGAVISRLKSYQVDAVIALAAPFSADIVKSCRSEGKPLVLMNRYDGPDEVSTVGGDSARGGALVAEHLVTQGASSFAFMAGEDNTLISAEREAGFTARLAEFGHSCNRRASSPYSYAEARRIAADILADSPDAVFCANDTLAFALMDTARQEFGRRSPNDIMVAGYDNSAVSAWSTYD